MEVKADEQITGSFCPRCGSETEQTCMWTIGKKDRNRANCTACGWSGYAYQCAKIPLNTATCPDGGILRECYKDPDWGQINLRTFPPGSRTEPHLHPHTNEDWYLVRGKLRVTVDQTLSLYRPFQRDMEGGDRLFIPAGSGHVVENVGDEEAVLIYWRSTLYDPESPDKEPWDPG